MRKKLDIVIKGILFQSAGDGKGPPDGVNILLFYLTSDEWSWITKWGFTDWSVTIVSIPNFTLNVWELTEAKKIYSTLSWTK